MIYKIIKAKPNLNNKYYPVLELEELVAKKNFNMTFPEILLKKLLKENNLPDDINSLEEQTLIIALHTNKEAQ